MIYDLTPSLDTGVAGTSLDRLLNAGRDSQRFRHAIRRLHNRFTSYAATCPAPFIAPDLIVTPEMRRQSELYLPITEIAWSFNHLYRSALACRPILSSTPFHKALSWADVFIALPPRFQFSANPARLLETLLTDQELLIEFLFASFLPRRFYGGFRRYPGQMECIRDRLGRLRRLGGNGLLHCLDAACGTGEDSYGLADILMEAGFAPEEILIEGWTLEPLEVWSAAHCRFPHDRRREAVFRRETSRLFERGYQACIRFRLADLTEMSKPAFMVPKREAGDMCRFDLIICNGLLGGPIINKKEPLEQVLSNLAALLAPDGLLLVADSFHDGWKSKNRNVETKELFQNLGLRSCSAGEGSGWMRIT
ncbi:MAG: hypothetical protein WCP20_07535 [Desulfuromonadales bacterium]